MAHKYIYMCLCLCLCLLKNRVVPPTKKLKSTYKEVKRITIRMLANHSGITVSIPNAQEPMIACYGTCSRQIFRVARGAGGGVNYLIDACRDGCPMPSQQIEK